MNFLLNLFGNLFRTGNGKKQDEDLFSQQVMMQQQTDEEFQRQIADELEQQAESATESVHEMERETDEALQWEQDDYFDDLDYDQDDYGLDDFGGGFGGCDESGVF